MLTIVTNRTLSITTCHHRTRPIRAHHWRLAGWYARRTSHRRPTSLSRASGECGHLQLAVLLPASPPRSMTVRGSAVHETLCGGWLEFTTRFTIQDNDHWSRIVLLKTVVYENTRKSIIYVTYTVIFSYIFVRDIFREYSPRFFSAELFIVVHLFFFLSTMKKKGGKLNEKFSWKEQILYNLFS